jgi:predicted RNA-binding protein with PIN domain
VAFDYLIVDGHSVIFAWPELRQLHDRRTSLARDELTKRLRHFQDWTGTRVVVVFDGKGARTSSIADEGEIQIFYSRAGQSADAVVERLASKYAGEFRIVVATDDLLEQETAAACGAETISCAGLRALVEDVQSR